jgi:hypothetical protein
VTAKEPNALPIAIVGAPSSESDAAIARFLERFLAAERSGTTWNVVPGTPERVTA